MKLIEDLHGIVGTNLLDCLPPDRQVLLNDFYERLTEEQQAAFLRLLGEYLEYERKDLVVILLWDGMRLATQNNVEITRAKKGLYIIEADGSKYPFNPVRYTCNCLIFREQSTRLAGRRSCAHLQAAEIFWSL